jgi:hypothetical protein
MSPNGGGGGGGGGGVTANESSCAHGALINFGGLTPYLTYGTHPKETTYRMKGATNRHIVASYSSSRDFFKGTGSRHQTEFKFFDTNE